MRANGASRSSTCTRSTRSTGKPLRSSSSFWTTRMRPWTSPSMSRARQRSNRPDASRCNSLASPAQLRSCVVRRCGSPPAASSRCRQRAADSAASAPMNTSIAMRPSPGSRRSRKCAMRDLAASGAPNCGAKFISLTTAPFSNQGLEMSDEMMSTPAFESPKSRAAFKARARLSACTSSVASVTSPPHSMDSMSRSKTRWPCAATDFASRPWPATHASVAASSSIALLRAQGGRLRLSAWS